MTTNYIRVSEIDGKASLFYFYVGKVNMRKIEVLLIPSLFAKDLEKQFVH